MVTVVSVRTPLSDEKQDIIELNVLPISLVGLRNEIENRGTDEVASADNGYHTTFTRRKKLGKESGKLLLRGCSKSNHATDVSMTLLYRGVYKG